MTRRSASEQKTRRVPTRDQLNAAYGAEQQPEKGAHGTDRRIAQRFDEGSPSVGAAIAQNVCGMQLVEALHDDAHLRLRPSERDIRFQSGNGIEVGVFTVSSFLRCERERDPDVCVVNACVAVGQLAGGGVLNIGRHHSDER
jgi:hypothetical protein